METYKKLFCLMTVVLVLAVAGGASASTRDWDAGGSTSDWDTASNWGPDSVPGSDDGARINDNVATKPLIASGVTAVCSSLYFNGSGSNNVLNMTGGTLNTNNGQIRLGAVSGNYGEINLSGGTITCGEFRVGKEGTGLLNMTGGTVNATALKIPYAGSGTMNLDGGTFNATELYMQSTGSLDIETGTLIIDGDEESSVEGYVTSGWLTAYGGSGTVNVDYNVTNAGKTTVTGTAPGGSPPDQVTGASPSDGATNQAITVDISWSAASGASNYDVYFGTDSTPDSSELKGNQAGLSYEPGSLSNATTYYWRIDSNNVAGTTAGNVWSFTTIAEPPAQVTGASPADAAISQAITVDISWSAASGASNYDVYFGTDSTPDSSELKGNQAGLSYEPGSLSNATTYYWRIDSNNVAGTTAGNVWSFTTIAEPPAQVTGASPADGAVNQSITADISWSAASGASNYDVYFGTDSSPDETELKSNQAGLSYEPGTLSNATTYYWRIDSNNVAGTTAGNVWSFTTIVAAPAQVTGASPADGAVNQSITADISWSAASGASNYDVYFGTDSTPDSSELKGNQAGLSYEPGSLSNDTTYYWRIDSNNVGGTTAGNVWSFTTIVAAPAQVAGASPADAATDVSTTADLSWSAASGATNYDVYFGQSSPGTSQGNQAATTFDTGTMSSNTTYYWRIDSNNVAGTTTGNVWSFTTTASAAPDQVTGPDPANGATEIGKTIDLSWSVASGASNYDVYFGTDSVPDETEFKGNQAAVTYDAGTMSDSTTYYWRIDSNNATETTTGVVWSFTTTAAGGTRTWDAGGGTSAWNTALNWGPDDTPDSDDGARINENLATKPLIDAGVTAVCDSLFFNGSGSNNVLNMTGGTLNTNNGQIRLGSVSGHYGEINLSGGTITCGQFRVGTDGTGQFDMTGGTVNATNLKIPSGDGSGTMSLDGGTFNATELYMQNTGLLDIEAGTLIIDGDEESSVNGYVTSGYITAYGGSGTVNVDYNVTNAGKTTVTGSAGGSPPDQATNPSPANAATDVNITDDLSWTGDVNATSHDVYFGTTSPGAFQGNQAAVTFDTGTMQAGTTYYWRINEKNAAGTTTGSVWSFTTSALATQASNPSPADAATDVNITDDLSWTAGTGATSHDVYFGTTSPGDSQGNQAGTTFDTSTMTAGVTYYWRIDEKNAAGTTTGVVWSFITLPVPGQASSPSPTDGATAQSLTTDLNWTAGSDASSRDVYFGTDSTPDETELQGNQAATSFDAGTLSADVTYYWRIDEKNTSGTTTGSVWSFSTLALPGQVSGPSPADGATDVNITEDLSWSAATDANSYDVYFGTDSTPDSSEFQSNVAGLNFEPGTMGYEITYYWRIDAVNLNGTTTGSVWSFTTKTESIADPNLLAWLKLNETSGTTASDSAGSNDGTLSGGPVWVDGNNLSGALSFDEVDDYVSISDFDYTNASDEFSISFWFKIDDIAGDYYQYMFSHGTFSTNNSINVYFVESGNTGQNPETIRINAKLNDGTALQEDMPTTLADGQWHMYTITVSSTSGGTIYIDANSEATDANYKGSSFNPTGSIYLGAQNGLDADRYFGNSSSSDGLLDDVRIYDRALDANDVLGLYYGTTPASNPSPADDAAAVSTNAVLSWTPGTYAVSHDLYFGTSYDNLVDANHSSSEYIDDLDTNSYDPDLDTDKTYYWVVDELDSQGSIIAYGDIWSFSTTVTAGPGQASSPSPADGATNISPAASLSWVGGSGALNRDVYFGTDSTPDSTEFQGNQVPTVFDPCAMTADTTYYWRIDSNNVAGMTTGSVWSFTTLAMPGQVSSPSPANAATNVSITADLSWTAGSGATNYDVYFGLSSPGNYQDSQTATSFDPGTLNNAATYYWRIDSINAAGTTTGTVWSFTTIVAAPGQVTGPSPADAATTVSITADLSWSAVSGADNYDVYFGTDSVPDSGELQGNQTATTYDLDTMSNNTTYYWCIDSNNAGGLTAGVVWSFTTEPSAAPGQATNPSPEDGSAGIGTDVDLSWTAGTNTTSHDVYFGTDSVPDSGELQGNQTAATFDPGSLTISTTYYWRINEKNATSETTGNVWSFTTTSGAQGGWSNQDIGDVGASGSFDLTGDTFTVDGSGADIWGTSDEFHFVYRSLAGDGYILARVVSVENTNDWAKGGVMIRESLNANSAHAFMMMRPGTGSSFQYRTSTGAEMAHTRNDSPSTPYWVKVVRSGNTLSGHISSDGANWIQVGSDMTITMNANLYCGLAVTSHSDGVVCTAVFDNVDASVSSPVGEASSPSPGNSATGIDMDADLSWTAGAWAADVNGHQLYFGTDFAEVSAGDANVDQGLQTATSFDAGTMDINTTYYWVVDEVNGVETWLGDVWNFTTRDPVVKATVPSPADTATNVDPNADLSWTAGEYAAATNGHEVYFGTDSTPDAGEFQGAQTATTFEPGSMDANTTYYWAVDEVNDGNTWTGDTWSFTTRPVTQDRLKDLQIPESRVPEWNPGVQGGMPDTSSWPIFCDATDPPYNAVPNDSGSDVSAIQSAINAAAAAGGNQVVYLPAGTYRFDYGQAIFMKSNVVLRGDGWDDTIIKGDCGGGSGGKTAVIFEGSRGSDISITNSSIPRGTTSITLADASTISVGDWVYMYQNNDSSYIQKPASGKLYMSQIFKVSAKNGNTLTTDRPLRHYFGTSFNPRAQRMSPVENAGIEKMKVQMDWDSQRYDPTSFRFENSVNCWAKEVYARDCGKKHVRLSFCANNTVYKCMFMGSLRIDREGMDSSGTYSVDIEQGAHDNLITNTVNINSHNIANLARGCSGNVFSYNYNLGTIIGHGIFFHGQYPHENLVEGNDTYNGINPMQNYWGQQGPRNTLFRNRCRGIGKIFTSQLPDEPINSVDFNLILNSAHYYYTEPFCDYFGKGNCRDFDNHSIGVWAEYNFATDTTPDVGGVWGWVWETPEPTSTRIESDHEGDSAPASWSSVVFPDSLYLSSKPSWWPGGKAWPCIGADIDDHGGTMTKLPAQDWYEALPNKPW